jgi:hypothetical protein
MNAQNMKAWNDKSLTERISEILSHRYGISDSSAVAKAVAWVIFNRNQSLASSPQAVQKPGLSIPVELL